jgi:REP element-mobilizing transposase RayT
VGDKTCMARRRTRHVQPALVFRTWGGKRKGAGRKQVNERKSQPHRLRPDVRPNHAVLVTLRVVQSVRRMRRRDAFRAIRKAMLVVLARTDFRVVHLSIQANHVHLVLEAESKRALSRGMQALQISAARRLNQVDLDASGRVRRGPVFVDRFHAEVVTTPTHARHALSYVLNNWRKHKEDRVPATKAWVLDPYSSAATFAGWSERIACEERNDLARWSERALSVIPDDLEQLPVCLPQSWLLREGWKLGGTISAFEAPSRR